MIFLIGKYKILNWNLLQLNLKIKNLKTFYFLGKYSIYKIKITIEDFLDFKFLKQKISNLYLQLNVGFIGFLQLNGLGFKATRKIFDKNKKYWRFNVGHSHVFQYFTPKNVIMKIKQRNIYMYGFIKSQIFDIAEKIKNFHRPDSYKGVGIKYPNEYIRLKKGKTRQ